MSTPAPRVHLTHHTCLALGGGIAADEERERSKAFADLPSGTRPLFACCSRSRRPGRLQSLRFTTTSADVTCYECNHLLSRNGRGRFDAGFGRDLDVDIDLAWSRCCQGLGFAAPAATERRRHEAALGALREPSHLLAIASVESAAGFRDLVVQHAQELDEPTRAAFRPALDEMMMAADLVDEAAKMLERARTIVMAVAPFGADSPRTRAASAYRIAMRAATFVQDEQTQAAATATEGQS